MSYDADLNFVFAHTHKVMYGANTINDLGSALNEMGLSKAVVVTDSFLAEKTDLLERAKKTLGPRFAGAFTGVIPDPTAASIDEGAAYAKSVNADALVSLGGGSAIDSAKGMAVVLTEGGKVLDHEGYHALARPLTPHIAIPTTAGTGSEMTMVLVVKDPERGQKTFIGSYFLHPNLAILDPTLTVGLPAKLTAATGMDALSHAIEGLFSTLGNPMSDACATEAIRLIAKYLPGCIEKPDDLVARGQMLIASAMAGSAFSNAMASLNHAMAHTVGAKFGIHHGTANAMFLANTMRFFSDVSADRLAIAAQAMGISTSGLSDAQAAEKAADRVEQLVKEIGLTDRLSDYGVSEENLAEIADMAMTDGTIIYSPKPVFEPEEIIGLLRKVL
ncbi:MAG: iron-containing alcohol dehydrogenase [Deltaproteobacteria bacterium]|nr:iron-containing alcohol dehydrogenase [Deltaproteobacteria bacterium]